MTLYQIAEALQARRVGPGRFMARCVAHEDKNPSLSLTEGRTAKIIVYCFAGCEQREIIQKLDALGLWPKQEVDVQLDRRELAQAIRWRDLQLLELRDYSHSLDNLKRWVLPNVRNDVGCRKWINLCREQQQVRLEGEALRRLRGQELIFKMEETWKERTK